MFARELSANRTMMSSIRRAIEAGLPAYAECGGLMVLARSITWNNVTWPMAGALPADVVMQSRPVGRGYVHVEETAAHPWPRPQAGPVRAHEFHYSRLENVGPDVRFAYRVRRGHGLDGERDGIVIRNLLASYTHRRSLPGDDWPARFVAFARRVHDAAGATPGAAARVA
jgi:cobyrinic acid a,c-diamide synthase